MRQRVLIAFVGLTVAILVGAVVPLGWQASARDYAAYLQDAKSRTRAATAAAEELLSDKIGGPELRQDLLAAARQGDSMVVMSARGAVVARAGSHFAVPASMIAQATSSRELVTQVRNDQVLVVAPVRSNGQTVGVTALRRPTRQLEFSLRTFWLTLIVIALAALAAAVLIAVGLSRWAARPLAQLGASARRLGEGDLTARAPSDGPAEVRELSETFNAMAGRLETLVHSHRVMLADVSHQLRTPLAALRLQLEGLAAEAGDGAADVTAALTEVSRLGRMVDGLLAVARAENATPDMVPVSVHEVVAERTAAWSPVAEEQGVTLTSQTARPARVVLGDGYLEQILDNLIANAIEATSAGNRITVTAEPTARGARVTVADNGPGMTQADMDRAFLRFASNNPRGSGLGLAIVYRLAASGGGGAALSQTPGGGLTVTVDLCGPVPEPGKRLTLQREALRAGASEPDSQP
jgi:signal transduction histidine kinase